MSAVEILEQIRRLPPAEQYDIAEQIWAEFGGLDDELTREQIVELERRAAAARAHPELCRPMEDVFADIEKRHRVPR